MCEAYAMCYVALTHIWEKYPIADDYVKVLSHCAGYENWIPSENIDLFMADNYDFGDEQDSIIEQYLGENWDLTDEFPNWCRKFFSGYWWEDFIDEV